MSKDRTSRSDAAQPKAMYVISVAAELSGMHAQTPVSYTHLTLPTILLV